MTSCYVFWEGPVKVPSQSPKVDLVPVQRHATTEDDARKRVLGLFKAKVAIPENKRLNYSRVGCCLVFGKSPVNGVVLIRFYQWETCDERKRYRKADFGSGINFSDNKRENCLFGFSKGLVNGLVPSQSLKVCRSTGQACVDRRACTAS